MLLTSPSATSECISRANFLIDELLLPAVFPHHVTRLQTRETHISWVLLTGPFAYKIKKSVKFPFIDTTSLAKRRELCELELRLNRRFAPDLYVDVVAITREPAGLRIGGQGKIIEYAVRMKQFDESEELCSLLDRGAVDNGEIVDLAQRLAEFHGSAPIAVASADFKHTNALRDAVLGNLATLISHLNGIAGLTDLGRLSDWTHDFLHESIVHFRQREECGFIRECHGDLHARNVVRWQGQLLPFDCLEFDPALRWIDVMNDAAFLVMDLISHGRADLAYSFLNRYLETSGDYAGVRLLPFYAIYRALVRAMVDALGAEGVHADNAELICRLRQRVHTATQFMDRPAPMLIIMYGASGSGKSWLSEQLAGSLAAIRIRSDVERKRLARIQRTHLPGTGIGKGIYTAEFSHRTYAHLLECAQSCIEGRFNTIVDAAFLHREDRRMFQDFATYHRVGYTIIACEADAEVMIQRINARQAVHSDASEAGVDVLENQLTRIDPLDHDERAHLIAADTTSPRVAPDTIAALRRRSTNRKL